MRIAAFRNEKSRTVHPAGTYELYEKKDIPGRRTKTSGLNMDRRNKFLYLTGALGDAFLMVSQGI